MPILHLTSRRNQRDFVWPAALLVDRPEPTWPEIEAAAASAAAEPGPLYLTGGEPTLRHDLFALLTNLERTFPERDLVLVSNGRSFCYETMCDALEAQTTRLTVEVVIASTRRDVHDALVSVAESFDQASKGVQNLVARGCCTRVRVLVGSHNIDHLHEIAAWIPDRFTGIERAVWDVATLAAPENGKLGLPPDEICSYLESAINLLRARGMAATVIGMPVCAMSEAYRGYLDRTVMGVFRANCSPCEGRARCPGLFGSFVADPAVRVRPIVAATDGEAVVNYERYLLDLLRRYVPAGVRPGAAVLDAMCGRGLRNLPVLQRFCGDAVDVHATDIDLDDMTASPPGTHVFRADVCQPLPTRVRYALIVLFKPPGDGPGRSVQQALAQLVAALEPGGQLLIVLAEHTDVDPVLEVLRRLDVTVLTSEPNALRTHIEPEHKWVIVCRRSVGGL
jgi:hypothetical protein